MGEVGELRETVENIDVPDLSGAVGKVVNAAAKLSILSRFLVWLAQTDVLGFWKDLFGALISDIASFDDDLSDTKEVIDNALDDGDLVSRIQAQLDQMRAELLAEHDRLAQEVEAQLAAAIAVVEAGLNQALTALDVPLLAGVGDQGANPFQKALAELAEAVREKLDAVRKELVDGLQALSTVDKGLFRTVVIVYLVLPILAAVAIGLAGGPFVAAALAAIVLVAAQQLLHLILRWLSGPLTDQLADLRHAVDEAVRTLQALVETTTVAVDNALDATGTLRGNSSSSLRGSRHSVTCCLGSTWTRPPSCLAPHATPCCDGRRRPPSPVSWRWARSRAPPSTPSTSTTPRRQRGCHPPCICRGGTSPGRFAGERPVADLSRLVEHQLRQDNGREMLLTQRVSLFSLLQEAQPANPLAPADALKRLLLGQDVLIELSEQALLDSTHPGAYRALIHRVRLTGVVSGLVEPSTVLPVQLTHLGPSRTRVKRDAAGSLGSLSRRLSELLGPQRIAAAYALAADMGTGLGPDGGDLLGDRRAELWSAFLSWAVRFQVRAAASELGLATEHLESLLNAFAVRLDRVGFPLTSSLVGPVGNHVPVHPDGKPFWLDDRNEAHDPFAIQQIANSVTGASVLPPVDPRYGRQDTCPRPNS